MKIPIRAYWSLLQKYLRLQWKMALLLAVLLFSSIALRLINPLIIGRFIDAAQAGASNQALFNAALLFLALAVAFQIVSVLAGYVSELVAWTATNALRLDLAAHCLRLDLSFHNTHTPGEMIERLDGDVNNLANFFSRLVIELLGSTLLLAGTLVMLWLVDWRVGLGMTVFIVIAFTITLRFRNIAVPHWKAERQASADFFGFLEERLAGTEDIRANGAEAYTLRNFHALIRQMLRTSLKAGMMNNILYNTLQFLYAAGIATAFALSAYLFQDGVITLGTVFLIFQYATMLERPIDSITHQIGQLQRASAGILRIQELLAVKNKIVEPQTPIERASVKPGGALALKFDAVTFGYDDAPPVAGARPKGEITPKNGSPSQTGEVAPAGDEQSPKEIVLHDLSFTLEAGKVLGLLGRTGSGKTTLTRLLFRFYDPDQGTVLLGADGLTDLRQLPLQTLRQQVGMVTQNIQLFNASVRDNLTFFDRSVPDVQIEAVIAELGLSEWFRALPQGLDTVLESGGGGLSAGEAQLLAFTRIFLANPGLVVLDEASSRLDPATESLIERAVERLVQGRTAIIIAHRLGTVQKADEIMILNQGRIEEHGERQALAGDPGSRFFQLLQTGLEEVLV